MKRNPHPKKEIIRDCGVRAICLAFDQDYEKVFKIASRCKRINSPDSGYWSVSQQDYIYRTISDASKGLNKNSCMDTLDELDIDVVYKTTAYKEYGRDVHLYFHADNLPQRCIAHVNRHWVAVRDGAIWDTWDSRGKRKKKLYGYVCLRSDL
tara:strand:- start:353 stop:808 length:456 start_codon:yes stop_codon:yes gene_type:complete